MARRTPRWSNTRRNVRRPGQGEPRPTTSRWGTVLLWAVTIGVVAGGLVVAAAYDVPLCSRYGPCEDGGFLPTLLFYGVVTGAIVGVVYLLAWRVGRRRHRER